MENNMIKIFGGLSLGLLSTELAWRLWKIFNQKLSSSVEAKINEVLIFSDEFSHCRDHAITRIPCSNKCPVTSVKRLVYYLNSSIKTLDICIYMVTCSDITRAIIDAQKRKVRIRIIIDAGMWGNGACHNQLEQMKRHGVKIRMKRSNSSLMHHKFALIDSKIMIYGSINWTMQAFYGNFDGLLITNQHEFVSPFINEFNRMWEIMQ